MKLLIQILFCIVLAGIHCSCTTFPEYPTSAPVTYIVQQPYDYNCYTKKNGTQKIKLWINITSSIFHNNQMKDYDKISIAFDPTVNSFPISLSSTLPSTGPYRVEINIIGEECSPCANRYSFADESPYGICANYFIAPGPPPSYRAAKPRWSGGAQEGAYLSTMNLGACSRIPNVPNSCGCVVYE